MAPHRIYRFSIWLPLIVPALVMVVWNVLITGLGVPKPSGVFDVVLEVLAYSGIWGGPPYLLLAAWATWWMRGRSERDIRRVMFLAPLLMVAVFGATCLVMGLFADRMRVWLAVAGLGISIIIPLGYAYVALAVGLRHWLGPRAIEHAP